MYDQYTMLLLREFDVEAYDYCLKLTGDTGTRFGAINSDGVKIYDFTRAHIIHWFEWDTTPQGFKYWQRLHDKIQKERRLRNGRSL